jgi:hypothetical protein
MRDRVVLDEELAWRLFGSVHVAGFDVLIGGIPHTVAGVVARENDFASSAAYTYGAGMFMSYESLRELTYGQARISTYEIVLSDPVSGFAMDIMTQTFPSQDAHIVENSTRYSLSNIFSIIGSFGERSMRTSGIVYPYWENAARFTEDRLALLYVLALVFVVCPAVFGVIYGVKAIRFTYRRIRSRISKKIEARDERDAAMYVRRNPEEFVTHSIEDIIREYIGDENSELQIPNSELEDEG